MRLICYVISKSTLEHFSETSLVAVGGALFLRFYAPFIIAPESYGVLEPDQVLHMNTYND
jgi:hypothetical protein